MSFLCGQIALICIFSISAFFNLYNFGSFTTFIFSFFMQSSFSSSNINRVPIYFYLVLLPLCFFIKLWHFTLRLKISGEDAEFLLSKDKFFVMFWHNRIFVLPYLKRVFRRRKKMSGLVSASKDGALLAALFNFFDIDSIRGSSRKRKVASLFEIAEAVGQGSSVCITPDGPIGPIYKLKKDSLKVAEFTDLDILFLRVNYRSYFTLPTWDKFQIPLPFSSVDLKVVSCRPYSDIAQSAQKEGVSPVEYAEHLMGR